MLPSQRPQRTLLAETLVIIPVVTAMGDPSQILQLKLESSLGWGELTRVGLG